MLRAEWIDRVKRITPFIATGLLGWALVSTKIGSLQAGLVIAAGVLTVLIVATAFLVPWERLPDWPRVLPPVVYIAVVALLRQGAGGVTSGYNPLFLLPVFWLALYGAPWMLGVGLVSYALAQLSWVLLHGRNAVTVAVLSTVVTTIICVVTEGLVRRSREHVADLEAIGELPRRRATEERPEVMRLELCQVTRELCGGSGAALYHVHESGELHPIAACGADGTALAVEAVPVPGAATAAVQTGQPVFIRDVGDEPDLDPRWAHALGVRSALWQPAIHGGPPVGALIVGWSEPRRSPDAHASAVMRILSAEAAVTLQRSELLALRARQMEELRELDRLKTDFVSAASHELRTPITSIRGYLDILVEGEAGELTAEQRGFLDVVDRNAHRLQALVDDLLVVSRIESGRLQLSVRDTDLTALAARVGESMTPQLEQGGVRLSLRGPPRVTLPIDEGRIEQVLTNVVSNAVKFSGERGEVTVTIDDRPDGARVTVADTGIGMSQQDLGHLFEKFFRAESATENGVPGTGLGLTICRGIVEAHGGTIAVDSVLGEGTTVNVYIPRVNGDPKGNDGGNPQDGSDRR